MRASNSRLLAVGVVVLAVGVALVLLIVRNSDDGGSPASPVATESSDGSSSGAAASASGASQQQMTAEELSSARLPLPLSVAEGQEAIAVRANFMRAVAAVPAPGDLVNLYHLPQPTQEGGGEGDDDAEEPAVTPSPDPDGELIVQGAEVLAVTGPMPASNDGTLTMVVAVDPADVPGLMPMANASEIWFTLLPSPEEQPQDAATEDAA